ncbi:hypothetical protein HK101_010842 [Irineochytrium annulatum]|nr:hypothetical protein HK101_010842 [Irineochytrium annulatum]
MSASNDHLPPSTSSTTLHDSTNPILHVRAGPNVDHLSTCAVNDEHRPCKIVSPLFKGAITIRIRDFAGVTPSDSAKPLPNSPYFDGTRRLYSIQCRGSFAHDVNADDVVMACEFDRPFVGLPMGIGIAVAFARWIDPGLDVELHGGRPCIKSPLVTAMNTLANRGLGSKVDGSVEAEEEDDDWKSVKSTSDEYPQSVECGQKPEYLQGPIRHSENFEDPSTGRLFTDAHGRRRHYLSAENRRALTFKAGVEHCWDFYSPYIDFNRLELRMGLHFGAKYYLDGQPVRFVVRNTNGSEVYYVVEFAYEET